MVSYRAAVVALAVFLPNFAFASKVNRRFENTTELKSAVDQYNDDACISSADGSGCVVGQTYGWPMNTWDVSDMTDMYGVFEGASSFNEDISDWVVSQVTDMSHMFRDASSFNGDLSKWEVSKVTYTSYMFLRAFSFDCDLSEWDISQVKYMYGMFNGATSFNRDLSEWDISQVEYMSYMFDNATSFNQDLCAWNDKFTPNFTGDIDMFKDSGCMFQDEPDKLEGGPWCASPCQEDENDGVSTVTSTTAIMVIAATLIFVQNML